MWPTHMPKTDVAQLQLEHVEVVKRREDDGGDIEERAMAYCELR